MRNEAQDIENRLKVKQNMIFLAQSFMKRTIEINEA